MGVDFIREQSGKSWLKRWDRGLNRLKSPSLFDVQFCDRQRTVLADLHSTSSLKTGDQVIVQCQGSTPIICNGHQRVGTIPAMPAEIQAAISECGGVALGTVERVGLFGSNVELSIR